MIKVFNVKDLIKYFIKITIPLIAIMFIAKTLFSINNTSINFKYETAKIYCLDDNIPQIKNNRQEIRKKKAHEFLLAQELHIAKGINRRRRIY